MNVLAFIDTLIEANTSEGSNHLRFLWLPEDIIFHPRRVEERATQPKLGSYENPIAHKDNSDFKETPLNLDKNGNDPYGFKEHHSSLNFITKKHIEKYKVSPDANRLVRHGVNSPDTPLPAAIQHVAALDKVTNHSISKPLTVYRGAGKFLNPKRFSVGTVFKDRGFVSTSLDPKVPQKKSQK